MNNNAPLRLCGGKLLVAVTRERRYGPSRLYALTTTTTSRRMTAEQLRRSVYKRLQVSALADDVDLTTIHVANLNIAVYCDLPTNS